jgi:hypothetical protein
MRGYGVPVGSVQMWMTATAPAGWLFAHGQTFTAAQYPELALVFPSLKLPDLRGGYMRCAGLNSNGGWGDAANTVGGYQESSTARPTTAFTADSQGDHTHSLHYALDTVTPRSLESSTTGMFHNRTGIASGAGTTFYAGNTNGTFINTAGAHTHTINGGGDSETRPKTFLVEMIIKAFDQTITLVA